MQGSMQGWKLHTHTEHAHFHFRSFGEIFHLFSEGLSNVACESWVVTSLIRLYCCCTSWRVLVDTQGLPPFTLLFSQCLNDQSLRILQSQATRHLTELAPLSRHGFHLEFSVFNLSHVGFIIDLNQGTFWDGLISSLAWGGHGKERKCATNALANVAKEEKAKQEAAGGEQPFSHRLGNWKPSCVSPR